MSGVMFDYPLPGPAPGVHHQDSLHPMTMDRPALSSGAHRVVQTLVRAINEHAPERVVELLADDYAGRNVPLGTTVEGREEALEGLLRLLHAFPDLSMRVHRLLAGGGYVVLYWSIEGTHRGDFQRIPPTGCRTKASGTTLFRFSDRVITDGLHVWDFAGLLRSMRLLPMLSNTTDGDQEIVLTRYFNEFPSLDDGFRVR